MSVIRRHHCVHTTKERCARLHGGFVCDSVHFKPVLRVGQTKTSLVFRVFIESTNMHKLKPNRG
ncbi:unnamed protein product [Bathycoccus prasinos]